MNIDFDDRKILGKTGETISAIGIGTWNIRDASKAVDTMVHAVKLGLDMVDTAELYGSGEAEKIVGMVVKKVGRDNIFITTKLMPNKFRNVTDGLKAMKLSLSRLGVSEVDLLLVHWYEPYLNIRKMVYVLESIAEAGYTRYIGVSNFDKKLLEETIESLSKYEIVMNQVRYNVYDRSIEDSLLPYMIREGITVQAYTPLEHGKVAEDKFLADIGGKYGKTAVQVALNYMISHERITAIPKAEQRKHVDEFYGALGWRLTPEDIKKISSSI